MDQIREIFYWTATIALILISIFTLGLIVLLLYLRKLARKLTDRGMEQLDRMSESVTHATRTWRNLAFTRFIIRALKLLI